jgi:hypothetical protein
MNPEDLKMHPLCARMNKDHPLAGGSEGGSHVEHTDESGALLSSIAVFGPRQRIVIDDDTGTVLDGWNTLQAWIKAKSAQGDAMEPIDPIIERRKFASEADKIKFVLQVQLGRRNLSQSERGKLAAIWMQAQRVGPDSGPTLEGTAEKFNISRSTLSQSARLLREGAPALQDAVDTGVVPSYLAEQLLATGISMGEQADLVARGVPAIKAAVARVEASRAHRKPHGLVANQTLDRLYAEDAARRPVPLPQEARGASEDEMATPVAPRPKDAPAAASGAFRAWPDQRVAELQLELALFCRSHPPEKRMSAFVGVAGALDAAWRMASSVERGTFLLEWWPQLVAQHRGMTVRGNGPAIDAIEAQKQIAALRRAMPRNALVDQVCAGFEATLKQR